MENQTYKFSIDDEVRYLDPQTEEERTGKIVMKFSTFIDGREIFYYKVVKWDTLLNEYYVNLIEEENLTLI